MEMRNARKVIVSCYQLIKRLSTGLSINLLTTYFLMSSMNLRFMASLSSFSSKMKSLTTSSKAFSAFILICALPARNPDERFVLGSSCRLKFPSLMIC